MKRDRDLIRDFWQCGDDSIIEFAILRAHLNRKQKDILACMLDECMTQEEAAEHLLWSVRTAQEKWAEAADKLLGIPWVEAYAKELRRQKTKEADEGILP